MDRVRRIRTILLIGGCIVIALVAGAAVTTWALSPKDAYIEPAAAMGRKIPALGLDTVAFSYRAPSDKELVVWIEVYRHGKLVSDASPAIITYDKGTVQKSHIEISRVDFRELPGDEGKLKLHFEIGGASTTTHVEWPSHKGHSGWSPGRIQLSEKPQIFWAHAYAGEDGYFPAYRPSETRPRSDKRLVDNTSLTIIARAQLRETRKDADVDYSVFRGAKHLMSTDLLKRMQTR